MVHAVAREDLDYRVLEVDELPSVEYEPSRKLKREGRDQLLFAAGYDAGLRLEDPLCVGENLCLTAQDRTANPSFREGYARGLWDLLRSLGIEDYCSALASAEGWRGIRDGLQGITPTAALRIKNKDTLGFIPLENGEPAGIGVVERAQRSLSIEYQEGLQVGQELLQKPEAVAKCKCLAGLERYLK